MSLYNFKRLVKKYSKVAVYKIIKTEGYFDYTQGGIWVEGVETEQEFEGAVLQLTSKDLQYEENGVYSSEDRKLYCYEQFANNDKIKFKDNIYTVSKQIDRSDFDTDLRVYFIVRKEG